MSASVLDYALDLGSSPFHVKEVLVAASGLLYTYSLELVIRKIDPVHKGQYICVLVSARTELIFFLVAGIVLCFGFSRKIMLITH